MVFKTIISLILGYIGFTQFYPWVKLTVLPNFTQFYPTGFTHWVKRTCKPCPSALPASPTSMSHLCLGRRHRPFQDPISSEEGTTLPTSYSSWHPITRPGPSWKKILRAGTNVSVWINNILITLIQCHDKYKFHWKQKLCALHSRWTGLGHAIDARQNYNRHTCTINSYKYSLGRPNSTGSPEQ